jgi:hypothetical protein
MLSGVLCGKASFKSCMAAHWLCKLTVHGAEVKHAVVGFSLSLFCLLSVYA